MYMAYTRADYQVYYKKLQSLFQGMTSNTLTIRCTNLKQYSRILSKSTHCFHLLYMYTYMTYTYASYQVYYKK